MTNQVLLSLECRLADGLAEHSAIEAALLYGSCARGDVEAHSDIDVLIVSGACRKQPVLDVLNSSFEQYGPKLSLTIYTRKELEFLAKVQSLFLLHLKRESIVLFDRSQGFLRRLFQEFEPKTSYRLDFEKSIALIDPVRKVVSGSPNQFHRLSQLYALYRIFGVYLLAEKGIYEFSKEKMSAELSSFYPWHASNIAKLSSLRRLNNLFYLGDSEKPSDISYLRDQGELERHIRILAELLERPIALERRSFQDAVQDFAVATDLVPLALDYRLKTWFLMLVFDGLNLFCAKYGLRELVSLDETTMCYLSSSSFPSSVQAAAREVLSYLRGTL